MTNFLDLIIAPAYAAGGAAESSNFLMSIAPFILIIFVFYFIMLRPQQAKAKKFREELKALRRGDKVVTAGGIVGRITKNLEDSSEMEVEIAPNVRIMVMRSTITSIVESKAQQQDQGGKTAAKGKTSLKKETKADKKEAQDQKDSAIKDNAEDIQPVETTVTDSEKEAVKHVEEEKK